jgi:hypothetical protein
VANSKKGLAMEVFQSGQKTAKKAAQILVSKDLGFIVPTSKQKLNLLIAFAKKGKVVYGKAFDIFKLSGPVDLDDLGQVEHNLHQVTIFEIKSTKKKRLSQTSQRSSSRSRGPRCSLPKVLRTSSDSHS